MWGCQPSTIVELLDHFAREKGEDIAYAFLGDGNDVSEEITYSELRDEAHRVAAGLRKQAAPGARVLLALPAGLDFIKAFFGVLVGGLVAAPVYPPERSSLTPDVSRIARIAADCGAELLLCADALLDLQEEALALQPSLGLVRWLTPEAWRDARTVAFRRHEAHPLTVAMIQYTSGSAAAPKGVMLSHANLMANQAAIRLAMGMPDGAVIVSWLPLYHDMGLIGMILQPLYVGGRCYLMSPHHFIQKPARWLSAIARFRADVSGGPNFAFELCLRRVSPEARKDLDLSCWKVAFCGAEPIRGETLRQFSEAFSESGFSAAALFPCYGLAEASLLVTGAAPYGGAVHDWFEPESLAHGEARERSEADRDLAELVSSGTPPPGLHVRIVCPDLLVDRPDGHSGEVWVSGPSISVGYWNNPEADRATFLTDPKDGARWLRTGDLGFLRDGQLFVVGRMKDLIIVRGRNVAPQDVELSVQRESSTLRSGCGAAFGVDQDGEERLIVVQEVARARRGSLGALAAAAAARVTADHKIQLHRLILIEPRGLPKTRNGKIARSACRSAFMAGNLPVVATWTDGIFEARREPMNAD